MSTELSLALHNPAFANRVSPFLEVRALDLAAIHVVDLLAQMAGVTDPDIMLGLAFAVRAPGAGHVGVDLATVHETLMVEDAVDQPDVRARIDALQWPADRADWRAAIASCPLVSGPDGQGAFIVESGLLVPHRYWDYQRRLRDELLRRALAPAPGVSSADGKHKALDLTVLKTSLDHLFPDVQPGDRQRLGALAATLRALTIISGGPGTGKTFTVKKVLALLWDQWRAVLGSEPRVALAAPTGKAAVRMRQAILDELDLLQLPSEAQTWLTGLEPRTLHRLLGYQPGSPTRFRHGRDNPLLVDVVIVDEASMVDLAMMCKLIEAVPPHARIVLLGDRNQLASVEAGSVLADMTESAGPAGLRYSSEHLDRLAQVLGDDTPRHLHDAATPPLADSIVHFTKPYRSKQDSGIQAVAYAIADKRIESAEAWLTGLKAEEKGPFTDLVWHDHRGHCLAQAALDQMLTAYAGPGSHLERLKGGQRPNESREAFLSDVLSRLDSVRVLTAHRRGALGVTGLNQTIQSGIATGHPGCVRVDTSGSAWHGRPVLVTENSYDVGLMNGDVGMLLKESGRFIAVFPGETRGEVKERALAQLPRHQTVFAMTVHKSQGSEFTHTMLVLPHGSSPILTRELVYTGLTRAKGRITLCGSRDVLHDGLSATVTRASALGTLLMGESRRS